jgi:hypothetical protein
MKLGDPVHFGRPKIRGWVHKIFVDSIEVRYYPLDQKDHSKICEKIQKVPKADVHLLKTRRVDIPLIAKLTRVLYVAK